MTTPVASSGSTNPANKTGMLPPVAGFKTFSPSRELPDSSSKIFTSFPWSISFPQEVLEVIHVSLLILASTYSAVGLSQRFVTPKIVSGLKVDAGKILPFSSRNFMTVYSLIVAPRHSEMSASAASRLTGWPQLGHQGRG